MCVQCLLAYAVYVVEFLRSTTCVRVFLRVYARDGRNEGTCPDSCPSRRNRSMQDHEKIRTREAIESTDTRSREFEFKLSWSCPHSCPSRRNRTVTRRPSAQKPILLLSVDPRRRLGQTPQRTPAFLRHGACFGGSSLSRASKPMRGPCV